MPNILISFCRQNSILLSILCCFVEWPVKYSPFFKLLPLLSVGEVLDGIQTAEGFLLQTCYSPYHQNLYYQYPIIWNDIVTKRISFFTNSSQSSSGGEVEGFLQKTCFPSFHPNDLTHKPSLVCVSNNSEFIPPKNTNLSLLLLSRSLSQEKLRSSHKQRITHCQLQSVASPTTDQLLDRHGQTNIELGPTKKDYALLSKSCQLENSFWDMKLNGSLYLHQKTVLSEFGELPLYDHKKILLVHITCLLKVFLNNVFQTPAVVDPLVLLANVKNVKLWHLNSSISTWADTSMYHKHISSIFYVKGYLES